MIKRAERVRKAGIVLMLLSLIWGVGGLVVVSEREANSAVDTMDKLLKTEAFEEFQNYLTSKYAELHDDYFTNEINYDEYSKGLEQLEDPLLFFDFARESEDEEAQKIMAKMDESTEKSVDIINGGIAGTFAQFLAGAGVMLGGILRKRKLIEKAMKYPNNKKGQAYKQMLNEYEKDL